MREEGSLGAESSQHKRDSEEDGELEVRQAVVRIDSRNERSRENALGIG